MEKGYFIGLAILGIILSFGLYSGPLYWLLWKFTPLYKRFKWPSRHLVITNFALCILAGYGLNQIREGWLQFALIVITLVDLFIFGRRFLYLRDEADFYPSKEVMDYLKANPGIILTLPVKREGVTWEPGVLEFPANATMPLKITNVTGYDPFILKSYHQLTNELQGLPKNDFGQVTIKLSNITKEFLDFLEVKYIYADREFEGFEVVVKSGNGMLLRRK